jgi:hypothetical protein
VAVAARIVTVGIVDDRPNSAAVVIDAADTPGGVYTMWYFGGAPLELPLLADPGIILFLFFSSASAMAFIILSWSMAALANTLTTSWRDVPGAPADGW